MKQRDKRASKRSVLFGRTILSRREWLITHGFIFFGLICISIAIYFTYKPPISNLLIYLVYGFFVWWDMLCGFLFSTEANRQMTRHTLLPNNGYEATTFSFRLNPAPLGTSDIHQLLSKILNPALLRKTKEMSYER